MTEQGYDREKEVDGLYRTVIIEYAPRVGDMAKKVEEAANAMEKEGFRLISFAITNAAKGILVFHREEA